MKNSATKLSSTTPAGTNWNAISGGKPSTDTNKPETTSFHRFSLPQNMSDEEVQPPAHIWNNISNILDTQDKEKNAALRTFKVDKWVRIAVAVGAFTAVGLLIYFVL
jgi:hypothetical protein